MEASTLEDVRIFVQKYIDKSRSYLNQDYKQIEDFAHSIISEVSSEFPEFKTHKLNYFITITCKPGKEEWGNIQLFFDGVLVMRLDEAWDNVERCRTMIAKSDVSNVLSSYDVKDITLEEVFRCVNNYKIKIEVDALLKDISVVINRLDRVQRFNIDFSTQISELLQVQKEIHSAVNQN